MDKTFAWPAATALRHISKLDLNLMASGSGGRAMLDSFHNFHKATEVFPRTTVVKDVIRRDTQTREARQVHAHILVGRRRVPVELPLSGVCVASRLRRRLGRRWRRASGGIRISPWEFENTPRMVWDLFGSGRWGVTTNAVSA